MRPTLLASLLISAVSLGASSFPDPQKDLHLTAKADTVVFAAGCFWGVEAVFERVKGVTEATSGYAGGSKWTAHYEIVSTGTTGHAESVKVTYDPSQVTFGQLLKVYFAVAHDPTQLNRQGPTKGRSTDHRFSTPATNRSRWPSPTSSSSARGRSFRVRSSRRSCRSRGSVRPRRIISASSIAIPTIPTSCSTICRR